MDLFCHYCKTENNQGFTHCKGCGKERKDITEDRATGRRYYQTAVIVAVLFLAVCFGGSSDSFAAGLGSGILITISAALVVGGSMYAKRAKSKLN